MSKESMEASIARLETEVHNLKTGLGREIEHVREDIQALTTSTQEAFQRGSDRMKDLEAAKWKQWVAIIVVAITAGKASPWIYKVLGI